MPTSSELDLLFDDRCPVVGLIVRRGSYRVPLGVRDELGCELTNASHRVEPLEPAGRPRSQTIERDRPRFEQIDQAQLKPYRPRAVGERVETLQPKPPPSRLGRFLSGTCRLRGR